jgi:ribose/xylose/arabinose/galactoside ABC-type transport system permease subunit
MPEAEANTPQASHRPRRRFPSELGTFLALVGVYLLFVILCQIKGEPAFRSFGNFRGIMTHTVIVGIGALGMTFVIICGCIDLSAGSVIAMVTCVIGYYLERWGGEHPGLYLPILAVALGLLAGALSGFFNGFLVSIMGLVPFIATLGTMLIIRGSGNLIGNDQTIVTPENWLEKLMYIDPGRISPSLGALVFAPGVWFLLVLLVGSHVLLRYTVFGRHVYAVGSNEGTARLCGVNVRLVKTLVFALNGLFLGISGSMLYASLAVGDPTSAVGMELDIIAAVVIGGASLSGGRGSVIGAIFGALIMSVLRNGSTMMGWRNSIQNIMVGAVLIGASYLDQLKERHRK